MNQQTRPVYNQIDYIVSKHTPKALTTYGGTKVTSGHKLVIADLKLSYLARTRNRHSASPNALAGDALQNEETRRAYKEKITKAICELETSQQTNLQQLIETTRNTSRLLVGETAKPPVRFQDPALKALSDQRRAINIKLHDSNLPAARSSQLRRERNHVSLESKATVQKEVRRKTRRTSR